MAHLKQTMTYHHRQALSPRLQADDIEALLPVLSIGLSNKKKKKRPATAGTKASAAAGPATATSSPAPSPRTLVDDFSDAIHKVKVDRLKTLISKSSTHYESASATGQSLHASKKTRPSSAAIYRALGEEFEMDDLTDCIPSHKLSDKLRSESPSLSRPNSARVAPTRGGKGLKSAATGSPRPMSARVASSTVPIERAAANNKGEEEQQQTTELYVQADKIHRLNADKIDAREKENEKDGIIPIPHAPPRPRPTTAPQRPRPTSARITKQQQQLYGNQHPAAEVEELDGIEDDDDDNVHAAESMGMEHYKGRKPASGGGPGREIPVNLQLAASATKGTARVIPVRKAFAKDPFFDNFKYGSIRTYLQQKKKVEFGSYRETIRQQLKEKNELEKIDFVPQLPSPREFLDNEKRIATEERIAAREPNIYQEARKRQEKSIEKLSKQKMSAVVQSSNKLSSTLSKRPATAKKSRV